MQYRTYTFRAYPNKSQQNLINLTFIMCRIMYNTLLRIVLDNYSKYNSEIERCLKLNKNFNEEKFATSHRLQKFQS